MVSFVYRHRKCHWPVVPESTVIYPSVAYTVTGGVQETGRWNTVVPLRNTSDWLIHNEADAISTSSGTPAPELLRSVYQLDWVSPTLLDGMYALVPYDPPWTQNDEHLGQFFLATTVGQIFDVYGPRVLLVVGTILISLSLILTSVLAEYYQLMNPHGVIFGIGNAMLYIPSVSGESAYSTGADALISRHHKSRLLRTAHY